MSLETALNAIVKVLTECQIPYAVMGGLAVRVYAIPRFTSDVDLTIGISREELPGLFESLPSVGCEIPHPFQEGWLDTFGGLPLFRADFHGDDRVIEIDLFVSETPFQRSIMERRRPIQTTDGVVNFVSPEDLILLKLIASRPRDLVDIQDILFTMGQLDLVYMQSWAQDLSLEDKLRDVLQQQEWQDGENA